MGARLSSSRGSHDKEERDDAAKIVHPDAGKAWAYAAAKTTVGAVEAQNPGYYLCSWEAMRIAELPARMVLSDGLQSGEVYFLLPDSSFQRSFSLSDLCILASSAAAALRCLDRRDTSYRRTRESVKLKI